MSVYQLLYVYPKNPITQADVDARFSGLGFTRYTAVEEDRTPIPDPTGIYLASPQWVNDSYEGKPGHCYWPKVTSTDNRTILFVQSFNHAEVPGSVLDLVAFDYEGETCWWGSDNGGAYTGYDNTPVVNRNRPTSIYNHPPAIC